MIGSDATLYYIYMSALLVNFCVVLYFSRWFLEQFLVASIDLFVFTLTILGSVA
jgi:hypothetical protein